MQAVERIVVVVLIIFSHSNSKTLADKTPADSDCLHQRCGDLEVRYPFALSQRPDCPLFSPFFQLHCNLSTHKLFFHNISSIDSSIIPVEVTHITLNSFVVDVSPLRAVLAPPPPNSTTCGERRTSAFQLPSFPGPFYISTGNYFGSFGCTLAVLITANLVPARNRSGGDADNGNDFANVDVGGCSVSCPEDTSNPECGYDTCCVASLPFKKAIRFALYSISRSSIHAADATCGPTGSSYSSLFHPRYTDFNNRYYRLEINWALPTMRTADHVNHNPDHECSPNSNITIINEVPGYRCSCKKGYTGDGYAKGLGCKDVDECTQWNDCVTSSTCHNTEGSYVCTCNARFHVGDGRKSGSGCHLSNSIKRAPAISGGIMGLLLVVGSYVCMAIWWRERTKRKYFMKNGGLELQALLASRPGREVARIFTEQELKLATQNYAEHMKIGAGGFGTVFKGMLLDGRVVAVKKAKNMTKKKGSVDSEQFLNEMAILTQINHRHIVRLLGCCLETAVPLLVYEYVSNGNVSENLHAESKAGVVLMGWWQRLNIARQTAEALAYLHAAAVPPILHRDVKSANILLDDNFDAKVADFGTSRLVPDGVEQVETAAQGTIGYLDPEYFQTLQLTDKSDVYSLGVVLIELITGLKPIDTRNREPRFASLVLLFIHHMQEDKLDELIDARLHHNPNNMGGGATMRHRTYASIMSVAGLARRCLALAGSIRPSMSQVADELRYIAQTLQSGDDGDDDDVAGPSLFAKKISADYDVQVGAVVAHEGEFHVLQSGSIDDLFRNATSWPR